MTGESVAYLMPLRICIILFLLRLTRSPIEGHVPSDNTSLYSSKAVQSIAIHSSIFPEETSWNALDCFQFKYFSNEISIYFLFFLSVNHTKYSSRVDIFGSCPGTSWLFVSLPENLIPSVIVLGDNIRKWGLLGCNYIIRVGTSWKGPL